MTDAEYEELKYAAIAAGYKPMRLTDDGDALLLEGIAAPWNPRDRNRHSDHMGDALRLAARLSIDIEWQNVGDFPEPFVEAYRRAGEGESSFCALESDHDVCLAITRAAAEIGKQMGGGNV